MDPTTHGAMFVPIILGSDKTTVSVATGQHVYHPVYLSVGNVHNRIRRAHKAALVLIGFLPVPKGCSLTHIYTIKLTQPKGAARTERAKSSATSAIVSSMGVLS